MKREVAVNGCCGLAHFLWSTVITSFRMFLSEPGAVSDRVSNWENATRSLTAPGSDRRALAPSRSDELD